MERIIPSFFINHCKENLEYYRGIFGGEVKHFVYYPDLTEKLMHAELHINENCILFLVINAKSPLLIQTSIPF